MALFNLIRAYTATLGTGDVTPGAAVPGYLDFTGITGAVSYGLANIDAATGKVSASEVGHGTVTAGVLSRDTVLSSTNGGAKIVLANAQVFITVLAEDISAAQIQSDWNQASSAALDYIKNKPTIPAAAINQLTGDASAGPGFGSEVLTLATVNASPGAIAYPASITVNAKGLITAQTPGTAPILASLLTTRGDLLVRNATVSDRLPLAGVTGSALIRDATDPVWSASAAALVGAENIYTRKQTITGSANEVQLVVTANGTQTTNIATIGSAFAIDRYGRINNVYGVQTTGSGQSSLALQSKIGGDHIEVAIISAAMGSAGVTNSQTGTSSPAIIFAGLSLGPGAATISEIQIFKSTASSSAGTLGILKHYAVNDMTLSGGTVDHQYGMYVESLTSGGISNHAWYSNLGLIHFGDSVDLASGKNITLAAGNIITDTTTGSKWATAANQKQAWWGLAPIVQPAHIADPSGGLVIDAEARTAINSINAMLAATGLTAAA